MTLFLFDEQDFFNLFLLGLWWQTRNTERESDRWPTVESVYRVITQLEAVNPKLAKAHARNPATQGFFLRRIVVDESALARENQSSCRRPLIIRHDPVRPFSRDSMMKSYRILITENGRTSAASIEQRYVDRIIAERYNAKRLELREAFDALPEVAKASIRKRKADCTREE